MVDYTLLDGTALFYGQQTKGLERSFKVVNIKPLVCTQSLNSSSAQAEISAISALIPSPFLKFSRRVLLNILLNDIGLQIDLRIGRNSITILEVI